MPISNKNLSIFAAELQIRNFTTVQGVPAKAEMIPIAYLTHKQEPAQVILGRENRLLVVPKNLAFFNYQ